MRFALIGISQARKGWLARFQSFGLAAIPEQSCGTGLWSLLKVSASRPDGLLTVLTARKKRRPEGHREEVLNYAIVRSRDYPRLG